MASYEYDSQNQELKRIAGGTLFAEAPLGTVIASFLAVPPTGYIKGDNTTYTKADYPELYDGLPAIFKNTTNETFAIDLREVALKGIGLNSLATDHYSSTGLTLGQFINDRLQEHQHYYRIPGLAKNGAGGVDMYTDNNLYDYPSQSNEGRKGATTEVKSVGVNYFIKAKQIGVPADFVDAIDDVIDNSIINRAGTFTVTLSANGYENVDVQLGQTLPNTNYIIQFSALSTDSILFTEMSRTTSVVRVNVRNLNDANLTINCEWHLICKR